VTQSPYSPSSAAVSTAALRASPEQKRIVERIATQRERLRGRRAARVQSVALADRNRALGTVDESVVLRAAGFARQHPVAVVTMAGVALLAGPRRLVRWTGVLLPILMRLRR
jgi:hypothetical protein